MDIQPITALVDMLSSLGFPAAAGRKLLWYACLRQKEFVIREKMQFGTDMMSYQLYFKEDSASKRLTCSYYDATMRKAIEIPDAVVNGMNVQDLEKRMAAVNWQMPLENGASADIQLADKTTWMQEALVEEITRDLELLASTVQGAAVANILKYKYWTDADVPLLIPELSVLKSRYELSQRFYVIHGEGITTHEAYRFLNNRWMERKIQADNRLMRQSDAESKEVKTVTKETGDKRRIRHSKKNGAK